MATVQELRRSAKVKHDEANTVLSAARSESRDLSDAELEKVEGLHTERDGLLGQAARAERVEHAESRSQEFAEASAAGRQINPLPHEDAVNMRGKKPYSMHRALDLLASGREFNGVEGEVHKSMLAQRDGKPAAGILIPNNLQIRRDDVPGAAVPSITTTTGSGAVGVQTMTTLIELLKEQTVLGQLGMQTLSNMNGAFSLPKLTAGSTAQWVAEGDAPARSGLTIGAVGFAPKQLSATLVCSRKFMKQSAVDAENITRTDLATEFANKIEQTVLTGSGSGATPEGLLTNAQVQLVQFKAGSGGANPTWAKMLEFEQLLAEAKVVGNAAFITTPAARAFMKQTPKISGSGYQGFLWDLDNTINGYRAVASTFMPKNLTDVATTDASTLSAILFGVWSQLILAFWGGMDVIVDPFTSAPSGSVAFSAHQEADVHPRHNTAFVKGVDLKTV